MTKVTSLQIYFVTCIQKSLQMENRRRILPFIWKHNSREISAFSFSDNRQTLRLQKANWKFRIRNYFRSANEKSCQHHHEVNYILESRVFFSSCSKQQKQQWKRQQQQQKTAMKDVESALYFDSVKVLKH